MMRNVYVLVEKAEGITQLWIPTCKCENIIKKDLKNKCGVWSGTCLRGSEQGPCEGPCEGPCDEPLGSTNRTEFLGWSSEKYTFTARDFFTPLHSISNSV
jgi:hypothetical protein